MTARRLRARRAAWLGFVVSVQVGCGGWQVESGAPPNDEPSEGGAGGAASEADYPRGFRVVENRIEDAEGKRLVLRGVNRSGTEYQCVKNTGIFDGLATEASVLAMTTWNVNAVRVPLNESCWLAINGVAERYSGDDYKRAILDYVGLLHRHGLIPILDLHWAAPGDELASEVAGRGALRPMPNADHSVDFWRDVAETFLDDDGVIFEPYNEPFPDLNRDTPEAWACWRDGCDVAQYGTSETYAAVGMQDLVTAIRETGSRHLILLGGIQYSNELSGWLEHKPVDPLNNLAAAWHVYDFNECNEPDCWNAAPAAVAREYPVVATEIGQSDCQGEAFLSPLMDFLDDHGSGYLAWSWNVMVGCEPRPPRGGEGRPWGLITDYEDPQPNSSYALMFRNRLVGLDR